MSDPVTTEIVLVRYSDKTEWRIDVSDRRFAGLLRRRGYREVDHQEPYFVFKIPAAAITVRSASAVGKRRNLTPEQRRNLFGRGKRAEASDAA